MTNKGDVFTATIPLGLYEYYQKIDQALKENYSLCISKGMYFQAWIFKTDSDLIKKLSSDMQITANENDALKNRVYELERELEKRKNKSLLKRLFS